MSVPPGTAAGDLILHPGTFETEDGSYPADIGTLVVPENHNDPDSRLIALPVVRVRAQTDHPAEPIFRLEGGPGISNMAFEQASRYVAERDVVLVGYRGVDGSSVLDAPEVTKALRHSADVLSEDSLHAYSEAFRAAAKRWEAEGVDIAGYTMTQIVEDLESARTALGYDRIDLLSESAGTRTAMIYAWSHPERIHRSIMIGVNPPGNLMWDPETTDEQIGRYSAVYARQNESVRRTDDLAATMRRVAADMPDRWLFLPIKKGNVRVVSLMGMMESTSLAGPFYAPLIFDAWLSAAEGDASGLWAASLLSDIFFPRMFVWGEYAGAGRIDAQAARDYFHSGGTDSNLNLGRAASAFVWGGGGLADSFPADPDEAEYRQARRSEVETLLISGELDLSTPPQMAERQLLPLLPNGHHVELAGIGHSGSFWHYQADAGTRLINAFLDSGRVDDSLYQPGVIDFQSGFGFPKLAKIIAGSMIGLALLTVATLIGMAYHVLSRGRFGRVAGTILRAPFAVLLGLGGWSLMALISMSTMPGVAIDGELLVALSAGLPVGVAIYLAWVDRDMTATEMTIGLAAAIGAALVGAWFGYGVTRGLPAPVAAILGSVLAANLALVSIIDGERQVPVGYGQHLTLDTWTFPFLALAGVVCFLVTVHVARAIARAHSSYAKAVLQRSGEYAAPSPGRLRSTRRAFRRNPCSGPTRSQSIRWP